MTTTTPAASVPASAIPSAISTVLQVAQTDIKGIWNSITGMLSGGAIAGAGAVLVHLAPDWAAAAVPIVLGIGGIVAAATHAYSLVTGLNANNNATVALVKNFIISAENVLGVPVTIFDDAGTPPAATA